MVFISDSRSRATSLRNNVSEMGVRPVTRRPAINRSPCSFRRSTLVFASLAALAARNASISGGLRRSFLDELDIAGYFKSDAGPGSAADRHQRQLIVAKAKAQASEPIRPPCW